MGPVDFVDADIPVHTAGRDHPLRKPCARILHLVAKKPEPFTIESAVAYQCRMHRPVPRSR